MAGEKGKGETLHMVIQAVPHIGDDPLAHMGHEV